MRTSQKLLLIAVMVALFVVPFLLCPGAEFSGADSQAEQLIQEIQSGYKPWRVPIWEPPSGEIASLLFSVQAALGALIIGYYIGVMRGSPKWKMTDSSKKKEADFEN